MPNKKLDKLFNSEIRLTEYPIEAKIKIGISACLIGQKVRFNGGHSQSKLCLNKLGQYFQWQAKGWIHPADPRGWFQWYCRHYLGRRLEQEDQRQIKRWKAFSRHWQALIKNCPLDDPQCRPKQRQALLHWAYDSRTGQY